MIHPYLSAYLQSNGIHKNILHEYYKLMRNKTINNQTGGNIVIDNFIFDEQVTTTNNTHNDNDNNDNNHNLSDNKVTSIFVGQVSHCLLATINSNEPNIVNIISFAFDETCNITKNLESGTGTSRMMFAFFKYISLQHPDIDTIILTDNSKFDCSNIKISLYMYYMLKYHKTYYEKQFGFEIDKINNSNDTIKQHQNNKLLSQNLSINKSFISSKLDYYDKSSLDEFLGYMNDGELVSLFLKRFKSPEHLCHIFNSFLTIIYISNQLYKYSISNGLVYTKYLHKSSKSGKEIIKITKKSSVHSSGSKKKTKTKANLITNKTI
jgi:hypothetical protein